MAGKEIAKVFSARLIPEYKDGQTQDNRKAVGGQSSKFIRMPNLKAQSFDRKLEICEMLDQLLVGPVRKDAGQKANSRRPSLSLKTGELLTNVSGAPKGLLTLTSSFRPFQKVVSPRNGEQTVSVDSSNPSPTQGSSTREPKINIWGGSKLPESHRRGRSFDIMLR
jgi:hypothetical protein